VAQLANGAGGRLVLVIIDNVVYDLSKFAADHPGGRDVILDYLGTDATTAFEAVGHSMQARRMLLRHRAGVLHADDYA
jgi:cytochrome b involved in lipid metabolism